MRSQRKGNFPASSHLLQFHGSACEEAEARVVRIRKGASSHGTEEGEDSQAMDTFAAGHKGERAQKRVSPVTRRKAEYEGGENRPEHSPERTRGCVLYRKMKNYEWR